MNTATKTITAAAIAFTALAGAAAAQQTMDIAPPGGGGVYPPTPVVGQVCPAGTVTRITIDTYGNQTIACYSTIRPINPIGAIIGGVIGGIISGGHH